MTRNQEIEQIKAEIARLTKRLKVLEALPEPMEEREISNFDDLRLLVRMLFRGGIKTVEDLITSTPDEILAIRDIGPKRLKSIVEWMKKHGLNFI